MQVELLLSSVNWMSGVEYKVTDDLDFGSNLSFQLDLYLKEKIVLVSLMSEIDYHFPRLTPPPRNDQEKMKTYNLKLLEIIWNTEKLYVF